MSSRARRVGLLLLPAALAVLILWVVQGGALDPSVVEPDDPSAAGTSDALSSGPDLVEGVADGTTPPLRREPVAESRAGPAAAAPASLLVRLIDATTKEPVPEFGLVLLPEGYGNIKAHGRNAVTDENGEALWEGLSSAHVTVFPVFEESIDLAPGERTERTAELELLCVVEGTVRDPDGEPVPGAEVWCTMDPGSWLAPARRAVADAAGRFRFAVHDMRVMFLFARNDGRAPSRVHALFHPDPGSTVRRDLIMGGAVGGLAGTVVDPAGAPVAGARVTVRPSRASLPPADVTSHDMGTDMAPPMRPATADAQGRFRFGDVPIGGARVVATAEGWAGALAQPGIEAEKDVEVLLRLRTGATVVGTARDDRGIAVAGASVMVVSSTRESRRVLTDGSGRYRMEHVEPGQVRLQAWHEQRAEVTEQVELEDGQTFDWNPVFRSGLSIRGVLLDSDGAPAVDRWLALDSAGEYRSGRTDAQGRFAFDNLPEGAYSVEATFGPGVGGQVVLAKDVQPGDPSLVLRLPELSRDAAVQGRILRPGGGPAAAAIVRLREQETHDWQQKELGSDGRFRFEDLLAGTWEIQVRTRDFPELRRTFEVGSGQQLDLGDLRLEPPAVLLVRARRAVVDEGWLSARLEGPGHEGTRHRVRSDGYIELPPLRAGRYRLEVYGENAPCVALDLELAAGQRLEREVLLPAGVRRTLDVRLPKGRTNAELELVSYDQAGRELARFSRPHYSGWGAQAYGFRPEAVRMVVTTADGLRAEAALGAADPVVLELR